MRYSRPYGWYRFAMKVLNKYEDKLGLGKEVYALHQQLVSGLSLIMVPQGKELKELQVKGMT